RSTDEIVLIPQQILFFRKSFPYLARKLATHGLCLSQRVSRFFKEARILDGEAYLIAEKSQHLDIFICKCTCLRALHIQRSHDQTTALEGQGHFRVSIW